MKYSSPCSYPKVRSNGSQVADLLKLDGAIDLVIPRGGKALVDHVKRNTRIPVLGHADGICHVFVDVAADLDKVALRVGSRLIGWCVIV